MFVKVRALDVPINHILLIYEPYCWQPSPLCIEYYDNGLLVSPYMQIQTHGLHIFSHELTAAGRGPYTSFDTLPDLKT